MLTLLIKLFINDSDETADPKVRTAYGTLCSVYGIFLNIILFAGKYITGTLFGSVAIIADAFNNLSDAGSSVITLLGFAVAGKKPDPEHPFGHGRAEYLSGLVLAALIMVMGVELGKSSFEKILDPKPVSAGLLPAAVLAASIAVKFYMSLYNRRIGEKINSAAMQATALDSLSDTIATTVVLIAMTVSWVTGINIDGWAGLVVAAFICFAGYSAARDTLSPLLGKAPSQEFVLEIENEVLSHPEIIGIHDLIVHDYGPGRTVISLHAEVNGHGNFFELHDVVDCAERELREKYGCTATIHLDPIEVDDSETAHLRQSIGEEIRTAIDDSVTIHDLRIVPGPSHTNVIFDAVLPPDLKISDRDAEKTIRDIVSKNHPKHFAVVSIDRSYV